MFTATKDENIAAMKNSAQNFKDAAGNVADDAKGDLKVVANQTGRKVREFINTATDEVSHAKETVTTQIRSNPVQSAAIALGVGFILGALLRR